MQEVQQDVITFTVECKFEDEDLSLSMFPRRICGSG